VRPGAAGRASGQGRDDIWGAGLNMSGEAAETHLQFFQFMPADDAHYVTADGRLIIDDPEVRRRRGTGRADGSAGCPFFILRVVVRLPLFPLAGNIGEERWFLEPWRG
jgi:hypothetical protein